MSSLSNHPESKFIYTRRIDIGQSEMRFTLGYEGSIAILELNIAISDQDRVEIKKSFEVKYNKDEQKKGWYLVKFDK